MASFPKVNTLQDTFLPASINSLSLESSHMEGLGTTTPPAPQNLTWTANQCIYIPIRLPYTYYVNYLFWINGATITTTSACAAVYTMSGYRIHTTGAVALDVASEVQRVAVAPAIVLPPGNYMLAYACNNGGTGRVIGFSKTDASGITSGIRIEESAFPAPATPNPVPFSSSTNLLPIYGMANK